MKKKHLYITRIFTKIVNARFFVSCCLILPFFNSCCNRPYVVGGETWPVKSRYPSGPYKYLAKVYCIQSGFCPKAGVSGANITVTIWNFGEETRLFSDSFRSDLYFEDFAPTWTKDGSLLVVNEKSGVTIKKYPRIAKDMWARTSVGPLEGFR